ncbi:MAG: hypothetical protein J7M26_09375, partial [Armatimonadetes bacterium]|nr:hypothetical protein [Armatimonadota bacterium]
EHGAVLHGNYGVLYRLRLHISNPTTTPAEVALAVQSGGGAARGVFLINGRLVETPVLRATNEHTLASWVLPAAAERTVNVVTMPQSGSNYPVTLILRPRQ